MGEKINKILRIAAWLLAPIPIALKTWRIADNRRTGRLWRSLQLPPTGETFTEEMVQDLPPPAKRYFLHAIAPGTPLASSVYLRMTGAIKLSPQADWLPLNARQILAPPEGFVWKASAGKGLLSLSGRDYYTRGSGGVLFWLWHHLPVVNAGGPDVSRSARGRLAAEASLIPSALLPHRGVKWEPLDDTSARAIITVDNEAVPLTLSVEPNGRLRHVSFLRWGNQTEDRSYQHIPFGAAAEEERTFGGYTIPIKLSIAWWFNTNRHFDFFRASIEEALFH
jgi:hypothetical protein